MVLRSFLPPAFLIFVVLGSIFGGWATPTEAGGTGCAGALLLAWWNKRLNMKMLREVIESSALTNALVFFIIFGATLFSFVFRALGGDDLVAEMLKAAGIDTGMGDPDLRDGAGLHHGLLLRLDRDLPDRPADLRADPEEASTSTPHIAANKDFMLWFAILMAVNLQSAFLTPPFGFALFYMKGTVPPSVTMCTSIAASFRSWCCSCSRWRCASSSRRSCSGCRGTSASSTEG